MMCTTCPLHGKQHHPISVSADTACDPRAIDTAAGSHTRTVGVTLTIYLPIDVDAPSAHVTARISVYAGGGQGRDRTADLPLSGWRSHSLRGRAQAYCDPAAACRKSAATRHGLQLRRTGGLDEAREHSRVKNRECSMCGAIIRTGAALVCAACTRLVPSHHKPVHNARLSHISYIDYRTLNADQRDAGPHLPENDYLTNVPGAAEAGTTASVIVRVLPEEPPYRGGAISPL